MSFPLPLENLGILESVSLRSIWLDEAQSFTPWLARPENLSRLGEVLGLDLTTEDQEVKVGPFSADILCKDTTDGSWVVIENQIEKTDHRHLGQVLTYAAGLNAKTMIWVAAKFTDEHRAALDWLNDNTGEDISFFGLEIELWRIGGSIPAPKFNIVSKPNDWSKAVRNQAAASTEGTISPHKQLQFEFWTNFREYVLENSTFKTQKPAHQHWLNFSIGRTGFQLAAITSMWNSETSVFNSPELRVEFQLYGIGAKTSFDTLLNHKAQIESQIDLPVAWHNPTTKKSCKFYVRRDGDFTVRAQWPELFAWLLQYLKQVRAVIAPLVQGL